MLELNKNGNVYGEEIHKKIKSRTKNYAVWLSRKIDDADLKEGEDFFTILLKSTGGRPKTTYEFTLEAAKEMCLLERNDTGKAIRRWILEVERQRSDKDLLSHDEVVMLTRLKEFFKYVENQKAILKKHVEHYVSQSNEKNPYAEFHVMRNAILGINKNELDAHIKEYCVQSQTKLPNIKTNHDKIRFLNEYDSLRNAVWDFLRIQGQINAEKLSGLVRRMAEVENTRIFQRNEDNLFQKKENVKLHSCSCTHTQACSVCAKSKDVDWALIEEARL